MMTVEFSDCPISQQLFATQDVKGNSLINIYVYLMYAYIEMSLLSNVFVCVWLKKILSWRMTVIFSSSLSLSLSVCRPKQTSDNKLLIK